MSVRLEDLEPDVLEDAAAAIEELKREKLPHVVTSTARTELEQSAMWLQGRAPLAEVNAARAEAGMRPIPAWENTYTITNCDGYKVKSNHQSRRALDICPADRRGNPSWDYERYADVIKAIGAVMRRHGFTCGQDWMVQANGKPSPYAHLGLGWDPPHYERKAQ